MMIASAEMDEDVSKLAGGEVGGYDAMLDGLSGVDKEVRKLRRVVRD